MFVYERHYGVQAARIVSSFDTMVHGLRFAGMLPSQILYLSPSSDVTALVGLRECE